MQEGSDRVSIAVAICTYKRNEELTVLLRALLACSGRVRERAAVGVVIVDDTAAGEAREVVDRFAGDFELGCSYQISGRQNISLARNLAVEAAVKVGEWAAMTDDDCEPPAGWLDALLDVQMQTNADCVTGRMIRRAPPGAPRWLSEQPFFDLGVEQPDDGAEVEAGATFNSMIRSDWLRDHPEIRFDPAFGVIGGEDMVFFRAARGAGLRICFAAGAHVFENEAPARATLGYQLYVHLWHGNSAYLSSVHSGTPRWRMVIHGGASLMRALVRPVSRLRQGRSPQFRYFLAMTSHAIGQLAGAVGVRVPHR